MHPHDPASIARRFLLIALALAGLPVILGTGGGTDATASVQPASEGATLEPPTRTLTHPPYVAQSSPGLVPIDVNLPSLSTGSPTGTLAVRVYTPHAGSARYPQGAPVLIWVPGGYEVKDLTHGLPTSADDMIIVTFVFPGGTCPRTGRQSDGTYDYRGYDSIAALRDVTLFAAGDLTDAQGRTIDDLLPVTVLHDNIGMEGVSNGGNIIVAAAALHGADLAGHLKYLIQWETPVSSQAATRDFGRVLMLPSPVQGEYVNPRYGGYAPLALPSDYTDLTYRSSEPYYPIFHDGNGDGEYTTVEQPVTHQQTPDLNLDGVLTLTEDFPLGTYPHPNGILTVTSRAVSQALADRHVFSPTWPSSVATPAQAAAYWDIREAVRLYGDALTALPDLEGMVLCSQRDHVQSLPDKPHIRQAFDGWDGNGAWVQLNPSPAYLVETDPTLASRDDLPHRVPNRPPSNWAATDTYCFPPGVAPSIYQLAAARQMADRAQSVRLPTPAGANAITWIDSEGDRIAVRVEVPEEARYPEGGPVVIEASTWFVPGSDFHRVNDTTTIGAVTVSYLWPERSDTASGARSEGTYDYGGPRSLEVLRDVIRFGSGALPDTDGRTIQDLVATRVLTDNVGLFASSHAGVVATNVLALHGSEIPGVDYLVGRENPTRDEMYACELGHFEAPHTPVHNPFFDEGAYSPITVTVAYTSATWYVDPTPDGSDRPMLAAAPGYPSPYILGQKGPRLWDNKRYYSRDLTRAVWESGVFTAATWPLDVATITETLAAWPDRITVHNYPHLAAELPDLKVMLVFASSDHVQAPTNKPHIHQAWDGFKHRAGLWVRMNPDLAYVQAISPTYQVGFPDNPANADPGSWSDIESWGFSAAPGAREDVWRASVAEMADRVRAGAWSAAHDNLDEVLAAYPPCRAYLPMIQKPTTAIGTVDVDTPAAYDGYTLIAPLQSTETYLIDNQGAIVNAWTSDHKPGNVAYLLDGGDLLRAAMVEEPSPFTAGGAGGRVERYNWVGNLLWSYNLSTSLHRSHHDVELLPNGNLLIIAWEAKTPAEAVEAGCRPSLAQSGLWPDQIIEINPAHQVVWSWRVWDHLIQDHDPTKDYYGIVANHAEKINLNYRTGQGPDWNHVNGIDYHPGFDQILLSVRQFSEIWVIDHGTTITEARGSAGDLLYRWGNPAAHGAAGPQTLFGQHDAQWIAPGLDGAGDVLLFNNGVGRTPPVSNVDQLALPVDEHGVYASGPSTVTWSHDLPIDLSSSKISGAQRLPNANTLICSGDPGVLQEVSLAGTVVWQFTLTPVPEDPQNPLPASARNDIFRAYRYPPSMAPLIGSPSTRTAARPVRLSTPE